MNSNNELVRHFAPSAPAGQESNWIPTGENFWIILRLYGPEERLFDKSWKLSDIEKIK
jgi:hypothetical protein